MYSDLVIIGSGMAATRLLEKLRARGDRRSITVLGEESSLPYNRIMLSPLLAGDCDWQQLPSHPAQWYVQQGIDLRLRHRVVAVDCERRRLRCADGLQMEFQTLVFATGSRPALPAIPGIALPGVYGFRDIAHVTDLQKAARREAEAVVLGGGLLGIEAAVALSAQGMAVTLVHRSPILMNRQLDATAAAQLKAQLLSRGVRVVTGVAPIAIAGTQRVEAVMLSDGRRLPARLLIAATGIRPVTELAVLAGLQVKRGIVVDDQLQSSVSGVFALGECCELQGETVGLLAPIWQQVDVLTANLCGQQRRYQIEPYVTRLKVSGMDVHVMGELEGDGLRALHYQDVQQGVYKKLLLRDQRLVGALLLGDVTDSQRYFELIGTQAELDGDACRLLLAGEMAAPRYLASA